MKCSSFPSHFKFLNFVFAFLQNLETKLSVYVKAPKCININCCLNIKREFVMEENLGLSPCYFLFYIRQYNNIFMTGERYLGQ